MNIENYDVVVIGGGPAGGQASRTLAKKGHKVLLVERHESFALNNFSSAGMTLEPLKEFNLPDSIIGSYWNDIVIQCTEESYHWKGNIKKGVVVDFEKLRQFLADETIKHGGNVLMGHKYIKKEVIQDSVIIELLKTNKKKEPPSYHNLKLKLQFILEFFMQ